MRTEESALLESAEGHEERHTLEKRLGVGSEIVAERFPGKVGTLNTGNMGDLIVNENNDSRIRHVAVGGRPVVENGVLQTGDIHAIRNEARMEAARLWPRMNRL
jgi:hypothetical protein